ncbi:MAG: DUF2283 domain-containing protein [Candidatus Diapherotrites archaeon]|nr:DUF2283 domain-containing protein [Candidatus Diapherotrites archaeon]
MEKISLHYDKEGDILEIVIGKPKKAVCGEIGEDILERKDAKSGKTVGYTILNFEKRFDSKKSTRISLPASGKTE